LGNTLNCALEFLRLLTMDGATSSGTLHSKHTHVDIREQKKIMVVGLN